MSLTLAIPCYNGGALVQGAIGAALALQPPPMELLVIDDGSTDGALSGPIPPGVRLIRHDRNRGLAEARNTALEACRTDILAFIDADAAPCSDLIARLAWPFEAPDVGGVAGQGIEAGPGSLADRWRSHFWRQTHGPWPRDDVPFVMGLCCAFRCAALRRVGGFASHLMTHGEDLDVSYRLAEAGYRLAYDPLAYVLHRRSDTVASLLRMARLHTRHQVMVNRQYGRPFMPVMANLARWVAVSAGSSLVRHGSPAMAALSPLACGAGLWGGLEALLRLAYMRSPL